jgi:hypothetical protein
MIGLLLEQGLLLGQSAVHAPTGTNSLSWFVVIFCVALGMIVALNPARRTTEVKRRNE